MSLDYDQNKLTVSAEQHTFEEKVAGSYLSGKSVLEFVMRERTY